MKFQGFCHKILGVGAVVAGLLCAGVAMPAQAQAQTSSSYAILIVGDESKAEVAKSEKSLISEIASMLESKNGSAYKYPKARSSRQVYSYHFNKDQEKRYCEKKLDILGEDVLFVGIIEVQPDRYPKRIVYRLDRVVNPQRSAKDVVSRIEEYMVAEANGTSAVPAAAGAATAAASTAAVVTSSSASSAPAENTSSDSYAQQTDSQQAVAENAAETNVERTEEARAGNTVYERQRPEHSEIAISKTDSSDSWRCQVGAFAKVENARECYSELRAKGHEGRIERLEIGDNIRYKVFVGIFNSRDEAVPTLNRLRDDGFKQAYICAPTR